MARTHGPLLSEQASGSIAGSLTFSKSGTVRLAKKIPRPKRRTSSSDLATNARLQFFATQWTRTIIPNALQDNWHQNAAARKITDYNEYLSYNLEQAAHGAAPLVSPLYNFPTIPPTISAVHTTQAGRTVTFSVDVADYADAWGTWFFLMPIDFAPTPLPIFIATSADLINTGDPTAYSLPTKKYPRGSSWWIGFQTFTYAGAIDAPVIPGTSITIA